MSELSAKEMAEIRWKDILENGKIFAGISPNIDPEVPPVWFDKIKFIQSQQLARKYYYSLLFGQFLGLILVLHHFDALAPLVVTGNSSTIPKLFRRYLSTMIHVKHWYERDPFDTTSKSFKSLKLVRGMHRRVSKLMNEKSGRVEGRDRLWIGQYGMTHAQFAFIGFVAMYPKQCGLHTISGHEFDCLLYFWRVIGYCLGVDDRFNLCAGTAEETVELCELMYWREWHPLIIANNSDSHPGVQMAKGICTAMNSMSITIYWNVMMKYWYPVLNVPHSVRLETMGEYFWYYCIKWLHSYAHRISCVHWFSSSITRLSLAIACYLKDWKESRLKKVHNNSKYENTSCPFDVDLDYVDAFHIK